MFSRPAMGSGRVCPQNQGLPQSDDFIRPEFKQP
jgi:hypothetical protein